MDNLNKYIHGYSDYETNRLNNQAETLADLLHHDSVWDEGSIILEAGCGIGAQTKIIAPKNKSSKFVSINISLESINQARTNADSNRFDNVVFKQADILELPFADEYFDHIFLSFVLEHIPNPIQALVKLKRVLKQKGTITIIEGDLGSTFFIRIVKQLKKQFNVNQNFRNKMEAMPILEENYTHFYIRQDLKKLRFLRDKFMLMTRIRNGSKHLQKILSQQ